MVTWSRHFGRVRDPKIITAALLIFLLLLAQLVFGIAYYSLIMQSNTTVSSPPVVLKDGTAGDSTIYTNATSAKVGVSAPTSTYFPNSANVVTGTYMSGTMTSLQSVDSDWYAVQSAGVASTTAYYPGSYLLLGSTSLVSGSVSNLTSNDGVYMIFGSYGTATTTTGYYTNGYTLLGSTSLVDGSESNLTANDGSYIILRSYGTSTTDGGYNPTEYTLLGSTSLIEGSVNNITSNDESYMVLRSYGTSTTSSGYYPGGYTLLGSTSLVDGSESNLTANDGSYLILRSYNAANITTEHYPSGYTLLGSTILVDGSSSNLTGNDQSYLIFRSYATGNSSVEYAHMETRNIGSNTYYELKVESADTPGTNRTASATTAGRILLDQFVYPLSGVSSIASGNWTIYYRTCTTNSSIVAHLDVDVLVRQANDTVRQTLATDVANSANVSNAWATLSGNYSFPGYTVVNQTDYLEVDFYAHITTPQPGAGNNVVLRIDDNGLSKSNQTRMDSTVPTTFTAEAEFDGLSNTYDWTQLVWNLDSAWTVGSVDVTIQVYNYTLSGYPASGDGFISYTSSTSANSDENKNQTIMMSSEDFRNASGYWKIKIKGVKNNATQFDLKVDWLQYKPTHKEYTAEVEFSGSSNLYNWSELVWNLDSAWTDASVNVTIQVFNYTLSDYPEAGDGYLNYVSSSTPNTDETKNQTISVDAEDFRNASGYWKIKVKGVALSQIDFKADWLEYKPTYYNEYVCETEFSGLSNTYDWTQLVWNLDSAWTVGSVDVTIQVYNYTLSGYPASGDGFISYTSSTSANSDENKNQTIMMSSEDFRNASGYWKIKIKGVKSTTSQFDLKADWLKYKPTYYNEYSAEVEFSGSSNLYDWSELVWNLDSAWTIGSTTVTIQVYNYTLGDYPTSGNGYTSYVSSSTANTDETKNQTISVSPEDFRNASGYWKIKVKGVKLTTSQFDLKVDWLEYKLAHYNEYTAEVEFSGTSNTSAWTQLDWIVDSAWTLGSVDVTIQVYDDTLEGYPVSGDGYASYTSSSTPNADETKNQSISSNPQHFRNCTGGWKLKVKGFASTVTQFNMKVDWTEYNANYYVQDSESENPSEYSLLEGTSWVSGSVSNLTSNDDVYTTFRSYWSSDVSDFVDDDTSDVDSSADKGTHSNFTAQQYGPDLINDTLTEQDTGGSTLSHLIIRPNAAGSKSDWNPVGSTNNWECVDEATPDEDTTFVNTTAKSKKDFYNLQDHATETGSISNVRLHARAKGNAGAELILTLKVGGVEYPGQTRALTTSYVTYYEDWATNPGGGNWAWSDIDSLETGFRSSPSSEVEQRVTQLYVNVSYTVNYELDLEVQWTSVDYDETNEYLCIYGGTMGSENITVAAWNGTAWNNLFTDLSSGWNNVSVSSYLTSSNFTIRFKGGNETSDVSQDSWNMDVTMLHVWSDEYTSEVEFSGTSNMTGVWTQLTWAIDSAWTLGSVDVTIQVYNYTLGDYPASGNGYKAYTCSSTPSTDETKYQFITENPEDFRNATGGWKIKVTGVAYNDTQFDFKADWIKYEPNYYSMFEVETEFIFLEMTSYQQIKINLTAVSQYDVGSVEVAIQAYNYSSSSYVTSGEGYLAYTSTVTPDTDEAKLLNITTNIEDYVLSGNSKIKITGVKTTTSQFQQKANQVRLDLNQSFSTSDHYPGSYTLLNGSLVSGSVPESVKIADSDYFDMLSTPSATSTKTYNCSGYSSLGSTSWVSGSISNLSSNNDVYMTFRSYKADISDSVDNNTSDVDSSDDKGTHSNFTGQQYGPDSIYDTLTEEDTGKSNTTLIDAESFEGTWPPTNWTETGDWDKESNQAYDGTYSADFDGSLFFSSGDLDTPSLNCSDADYIYVDFWWMDRSLEADDFLLLYYNGSNWNTINDLGSTTQEDEWLHYEEKITDSQYFASTFKIRWSAVSVWLDEHINIDLVTVKKEVGPHYYELDLEVQWTDADYDETNEYLCIYGGTMGSENITVAAWNGTAWNNLLTDLSSGWNNVSVSSYLTSSNFTVRFKGSAETGDTTQDTWDIDATLIRVWSEAYVSEVEFSAPSNTFTWTQLNFTVDSAWTIPNVSVTIQVYNYTLENYATSGNGYIAYTSSATPDSDETKYQLITTNSEDFRNATGSWKIKIKGVANTTTQFDFKADWIRYETTYGDEFKTETEFSFSDLPTDTPTQLEFMVLSQYDISSVNVTIQAYNYSSSSYVTDVEGYLAYTSSTTANTDETKLLSITTNPQFYTSSGNAKIKITSEKSTTTQFHQKANQIKNAYVSVSNTTTFDHVLAVEEQDGAPWRIRLKAYSESNIGRLQNCTIYFHNSSDGTSRQIYIQNGSYTNQTGPWYDLDASETIYIAMTVETNSTGTSYVRTYLEIRALGTTTYAQYIITFEIT